MHPNEYLATEGALTATVSKTQQMTGMSRSAIYLALGSGELRAVKQGSRTLILVDSIRAYLASLPPATFRSARAA